MYHILGVDAPPPFRLGNPESSSFHLYHLLKFLPQLSLDRF